VLGVRQISGNVFIVVKIFFVSAYFPVAVAYFLVAVVYFLFAVAYFLNAVAYFVCGRKDF